MSPITIEQTRAGGMSYGNPFVGPIDHTAPVRVDVSALDATVVDARGYLKPGVPLSRDGTLINAYAAGPPEVLADYVYGVTVEAVKVAAGNTAADLTAAADIDVAVCVVGAVNRAIMEDVLGRALTAAEIDGFTGASGAKGAAGSKVALIY